MANKHYAGNPKLHIQSNEMSNERSFVDNFLPQVIIFFMFRSSIISSQGA